MRVADKTYYLNADRTKALPVKSVKEGEDGTPDGAAYLLVREGQEVTDEVTERYGVKGIEKEEAAPTPGVVLSDVDGEQGFVAAAEVQKAGGVVTDAPETAGETASEAGAKKSAKRATSRRR